MSATTVHPIEFGKNWVRVPAPGAGRGVGHDLGSLGSVEISGSVSVVVKGLRSELSGSFCKIRSSLRSLPPLSRRRSSTAVRYIRVRWISVRRAVTYPLELSTMAEKAAAPRMSVQTPAGGHYVAYDVDFYLILWAQSSRNRSSLFRAKGPGSRSRR